MMHTAYATRLKNFTLQTAQTVQSVIFFVALCAGGSAFAQPRDTTNYPDRPIKIVVGF
ncbi:MAG: hypothetical protein RLZZ481_1229, partial [Pseudomonadota bacterium]